MQKLFTVYVHISPSNKRYFGITSQDVKKRWNNGRGYCKNEYFWKAIQKYGWDNFEHEIIVSGIQKEIACQMEKDLISEYKSNDYRYGYNLSDGGEYNSMSAAGRKKLSKLRTGVPLSPEHRAALSAARIGKPSALKGRNISEEHKEKIRKSMTGKSHPHRIPDSIKTQVVCDGKTYDSISDCAKAYGFRQDTMTRWLNGDLPVPEEFVNMGLSYKDVQVVYELIPDTNKRAVEFDGEIFQTVNKCAEFIDVDRHTISRWLNGKMKMPDYIKSGNLHYVTTYHYVAKKQN